MPSRPSSFFYICLGPRVSFSTGRRPLGLTIRFGTTAVHGHTMVPGIAGKPPYARLTAYRRRNTSHLSAHLRGPTVLSTILRYRACRVASVDDFVYGIIHLT